MSEDHLSKIQLVQALRKSQADQERADPRALIRLLQSQQIELELQNRELREIRQLLEESRTHLADLYDFAPVAYLSLSRKGIIEEVNLACASLFACRRKEE